MTPEFVSLRATATAETALDKVRRSRAEEEALFVLPVTDQERHLIGSVYLPTLVQAAPNDRVEDLMETDLNWVQATENQETAARLIAHANLAALPVIDSEDRMLAMITVDDAVRILEE